MRILSLEEFVDVYIDSVLTAIQKDGELSLDDFYAYVLQDVSKRTGFSQEQIIYVHHPFHWSLFLRDCSPLKLLPSKGDGKDYISIRQKDSPLERSELAARVLGEHRISLQQKLDEIQKNHS